MVGSRSVLKRGINGYGDLALSAYPIAVAAWEAYFYEQLLSLINIGINNESKIHSIPENLIDKWDIIHKSIIVPDLLYGKTFDKGSQPLQDFSHIVAIRNSLVHFRYDKPTQRVINAIDDLTKRKVFLPSAPKDYPANYIHVIIWPPHAVSSLEAIRWCINTIYMMAHALDKFIPHEKKELMPYFMLNNFKKIDTEHAKQLFRELGVRSRIK